MKLHLIIQCYIYIYIYILCFSSFQGADLQSTSRLLIGIIKMCFEQREWELLNGHILILTKRRNQLKQASSTTIAHVHVHVLHV